MRYRLVTCFSVSATTAPRTSRAPSARTICAARAITRYRFRGQRAATGLIMAPLFLPEIIVAVSLLMIILAIGVELSLITVILGQTVFCVPYASLKSCIPCIVFI